MNTKQITSQIAQLIKEVDRARAASPHDDLSGGLPDDELSLIQTRIMAAVERLAPAGSRYAKDAQGIIEAKSYHTGWKIVRLAGVLRALSADISAGYLTTIEELIHSALFEDFLEMAEELLSKGYKDPAAVVAGSVLEEHLRKLAAKNGLSAEDTKGKPKTVEALTIELVKATVFSEPQRKIVVGWYGQRTEAAHGRYENVIEAEVRRMIEGIRDFMVRYPA